MATKIITVNQLDNSRVVNTKFGAKNVWDLFASDGSKYTAWKKPDVIIGQTYEVEFEASSFGNNFKSIRPYGTSVPASPVVSEPVAGAGPQVQQLQTPPPAGGPRDPHQYNHGYQPFPVPLLHGYRVAIRQMALEASSKAVNTTRIDSGSVANVVELTLQAAREFEGYLSGDTDLAAAEVLMQSSDEAATVTSNAAQLVEQQRRKAKA